MGTQTSLVSAMEHFGDGISFYRHSQYHIRALSNLDRHSCCASFAVVVHIPCGLSCRVQDLHPVQKRRGDVGLYSQSQLLSCLTRRGDT